MKVFRIFLLVVFVGIVAASIWEESFDSDGMKVHSISVQGASGTTETRIRQSLENMMGRPLWQLPVEQAAGKVKQDPWVDSVTIHRQFPHTLAVTVKERKPVAVMGDGAGKFNYVDDSNTIIDRAPVSETARYPVLLGSNFEKDSGLRAQGLALLKSLPDEGLISQKDISDLRFDNEHGFQLTLAQTGVVIDIGKENLPLHLDRARRVVQYLNEHKINALRLDSDYAKKVLVKVRKAQ